MIKNKKLGLNRSQRGDTIVSVLLSIAIIGLVLTLGYFLINVSFRQSQQARERSQITKLAKEQVEGLKSIVFEKDDNDIFKKGVPPTHTPGTPGDLTVASSYFCLALNNSIVDLAPAPSAIPPVTPPPPPSTLTVGSKYSDCGSLDKLESLKEAQVKIFINYYPNLDGIADNGDENWFVVQAEWERVGGGRDQMQMYIRLHALGNP